MNYSRFGTRTGDKLMLIKLPDDHQGTDIAEILYCITKFKQMPSSVTVEFSYNIKGERPEKISKLLHYARALGVIVDETLGQLIFRIGRTG